LNSTVIPFQSGVFQLAFKAYEDAAKTATEPDLYCVPIAIKYLYLEEMHEEIDASLSLLESGVAIQPIAAGATRRQRLRAIAEAVLKANEASHGVKPDADASFSQRMETLKSRVIAQLEQQLRIQSPPDQPPLDRIRALLNAVDRIVQEQPGESQYEQRLVEERQSVANSLYHNLWRALRFVAIYDGYLSESTTAERFLDVLGLLELEVFKRRPVWGPRKACVTVGEPVNLKDCFEEYKADKRTVVQDVSNSLEATVSAMLNAIGADCKIVT
jgi:hypothetical protein